MVQALKKKLNSEKGFTLIELLAVIVILGILAAIAIPSVLGIIENSKKDAHVANVQQIISAAKMAIASDSNYQTGTDYLNLKQLETKNYLDTVSSPDSDAYAKGAAADDYSTTPPASTVSYVMIKDGKVVQVNLTTGHRTITIGDGTTEITAKSVTRSNVPDRS